MSRTYTLLLLLALTLSAPTNSKASDHIDGPVTTRHAVTDLSDLFVFRTPNKPGYISLILNAFPAVERENHFPDRTEYSIYVRKAVLTAPTINTNSEVKITCSFETPHDHSKHTVTCKTSNGLSATNTVDSETTGSGDFSLFAGQRSDPFFFDATWTLKLGAGLNIPPVLGDSMKLLNVLSIAIEVEVDKLFEDATILAVAADVQHAGSRLDFIGRPEVTNVGMMDRRGEELRDRYNIEEPFSRSKEFKDFYEARLKANLGKYDRLDGAEDLSEAKFNTTITTLLDDYLVIDVTKPCVENGYFAIETALINGETYDSCGGRHPNDDVMDQIFTLFVKGIYGPTRTGRKYAFGDNVDAPHKDVSDTFPYLAAPSRGTRASIKAKGFRKLFDNL